MFRSMRDRPSKSKIPFYFLLLLLIVALSVTSLIVYRIFMVKAPAFEGLDSLKVLSAKKAVHLQAESNFPVKSVEITITQGPKTVALLKEEPNLAHVNYNIDIEPAKIGLHDGPAVVKINARAGYFKETKLTLDTVIDTTAPIVSVLSNSYLAHQGTAAAALINAQDADSVYIQIGKDKYPATKGVVKDKSHYFCIFPITREMPLNEPIYAVAEDQAGNMAKATLTTILRPTKYKKDVLKISDEFIQKKVYPLLGVSENSAKPLESFLTVNEQWRKRDDEKVREIGAKSADQLLWEGAFIQMKNSKVFAGFGDMRDYEYDGKIVSHSVHLGYDLASLKNSPVEASNTGNVVFTGPLGIYGNTVIIDHGLNLMSMYSHLSSIAVQTGQAVKKGDIIATSGDSGFAGGDHLHFGIILHSIFVSPVPWWDKLWIDKRVLKVLNNK